MLGLFISLFLYWDFLLLFFLGVKKGNLREKISPLAAERWDIELDMNHE